LRHYIIQSKISGSGITGWQQMRASQGIASRFYQNLVKSACIWNVSWRRVWRPTRHNLGHFAGVDSQSLDWYSTVQEIHKLKTTQKANNTKNSKTKLPRFSRLLRHLAKKWYGLILWDAKPT